uniref:Uncharacterized protein n=1 Tax=Rhizophora mucronata TaxID=61149 RepID=A0A2P2NCN0_RHIMU
MTKMEKNMLAHIKPLISFHILTETTTNC